MSTENLNEVNAADTETGSAEQAPRVVAVQKCRSTGRYLSSP